MESTGEVSHHYLPEPKSHFFTTPDGRTLAVSQFGPEWAAEAGVHVVHLGGNPSSRLHTMLPNPSTLDQLGIRLTTIDFAGFGDSSPSPGGADAAKDLAFALEKLRITKAGILARSGGTVRAMKYAANYPDRVAGMVLFAALAPPDAPIDWMGGMTDDNKQKHGAAREDPAILRQNMQDHARALRRDNSSLVRTIMPNFNSADYVALLSMCIRGHEELCKTHADGIADGEGWYAETVALAKPWDCNLQDITAPTIIWQGLLDPFVNAAHARWLHQNIHGSVLIEDIDGSHFTSLLCYDTALLFLRDMLIGEDRAALIDAIAKERTQAFYGPTIDLSEPLDKAELRRVLAAHAGMRLGELALRPERERKLILRNTMGDAFMYPAVTKEVYSYSDADVVRALARYAIEPAR